MNLLKKDVTNAAGSLQVCAGQEAGAEAAIHAMYDIYFKLAKRVSIKRIWFRFKQTTVLG